MTPISDTVPDGVAVLRALATLDLDGVAMTIRQLRTRSNQPARTLAGLVGVTADAWQQWETGATHPRTDRLLRLGAVATQHALPATSHHHGVQVLCDLAALGPAGLATAIGTICQQTGDTPTQLAARIGVNPASIHGWTAGRSTPHLAHLVSLGKLHGPTSPASLTLTHVKAVFGVSEPTITRWVNSGKLPYQTISGRRRYPAAAVAELAKNRNIALPDWLCAASAQQAPP